MPLEIMKSKNNLWILAMKSQEDAEDAVYVMNKYIQQLWPYYGSNVVVKFFSNIDELLQREPFSKKVVTGRAET